MISKILKKTKEVVESAKTSADKVADIVEEVGDNVASPLRIAGLVSRYFSKAKKRREK